MNPGTTKVSVRTYTRANGTVVQSYYRSTPANEAQYDKANKIGGNKINEKLAQKAKQIKDALNAFTLDKLDALNWSQNIDDAINSGKPVSQAMIDKLSSTYDDAFKSAEEAMRVAPEAEKIRLKKEIAGLIDTAVYDAEIGASKYGTAGYTRPSPLITKTAVDKARANAGNKLFRNWSNRGPGFASVIQASKNADGSMNVKALGEAIEKLRQKPGMGDIAKTLTPAERYALNSRGITVSGRKFKAPDFRLNGDQSLKPLIKTINTMEKGGNPMLKESAEELAKVGVTKSAKTGAWAVTKTGLKAAGRMLPLAAGVLEATDRLDNGKDVGEATRGAIITTIASIAGSAAGGATAGSVIPGAGTIGGFIFGLVGGIGGAIAGGWASDRADEAGKPKDLPRYHKRRTRGIS